MATTSLAPASPTVPDAFWQKLYEKKRDMFVAENYGHVFSVHDEAAFRQSVESSYTKYQKRGFMVFFKKISPTLEHINSFSDAIGAAAQAQAPATIIWGGLLAVIECGCRFQQALDGIIKLLMDLNSSIPLFNQSLALFPYEGTLREPLANMYTDYIDFCLFAVRYFSHTPISNLLRFAWTSSPRRQLKQTQQAIAIHKEHFNFQVQSLDRTEAKEARTLLYERQLRIGKSAVPLAPPMLPSPILIQIVGLPQRNVQFVRRGIELQAIHDFLWSDVYSKTNNLTWCILHGMGGVGKTETALEYAHANQSRFTKICWIRAETGSKRIYSYCKLAKRLGLMAEEKIGSEADVEKVREWLESTDEEWLLVFDNVDDFRDLALFLPNGAVKHGSIIITTQDSQIGPYNLNRIAVEPFNSQDGSWLLFEHLGQQMSDIDPEESTLAEEISDLVDGLPLFLTCIGAFIRQANCTLREFIDTFNEQTAPWTGRGAKAAWRYEKAPEAVFDIALSKLPPESRELINILAFLNPDRISDDILVSDHEDPSLQFLNRENRTLYMNMTYDLKDRALVKRESSSTGSYFSIHRSLQQGILYKLSPDIESTQNAFRQAFLIVRKATPPPSPIQVPTPALWKAYETALPHIIALEKAASKLKLEGSIEFAKLLSDAGINMWERGLAQDGLHLLRSAEQLLDRLHCDEKLLRSNIHVVIALLVMSMGIEFRQESRDRMWQALQIREEYRKNTQPAQYTRNDAILLHNAWSDYGCALHQLHDYKAAEEIFTRCLKQYNEWGTGDVIPYEHAKANHHLALCALYRRDFSKAIELGERAVYWVTKATGQSGMAYRYQFDLASIILQSGDTEKALEIHKRVLKGRETDIGKHGFHTLQSCYAVGAIYDQLGEYARAEVMMKIALERAPMAFWSDAAIARTGYHLSKILTSQNKDIDQAVELATAARSTLTRLQQFQPMGNVEPEDEIALYDNLQALSDGRFTSISLLKYVGSR